MFFLIAFIWGGVGGLFVELIDYSIRIKSGEFNEIDDAFRKYYCKPCIISLFAGGVVTSAMSFATGPSEMWFLIVGMGASTFMAKFRPLRN